MRRRLWWLAILLMPILTNLVTTPAYAAPRVGVSTTGTWTSITAPNPHSDSSLKSVSCVPDGAEQFCIAVGYTGLPGRTLAEVSNGTQWTVSKTLNISGMEYDSLSGVSCTSVKRCIAVGSSDSDEDSEATLAELWNGKSWTIMTTPRPSSSTYYWLDSISCASSDKCVAVGQSAASSSSLSSSALAESWNGSKWSLTKVPVSGVSGNSDMVTLTSVSCVASNGSTAERCMAIGANQTQAPAYLTLLELWNGSRWTETTPPSNATEYQISGISCPETTQCLAVGYTPLTYLAAEDWNGKSWSVVSPTTDPDSTSPSFYAASCSGLNECMTVGVGMLGGNETQSFSDFWDGGTWALQTIPGSTQSNTIQTLPGLSCVSDSSCYAVGTNADVNGVPVVFQYSS
jgi:hypothetical protein